MGRTLLSSIIAGCLCAVSAFGQSMPDFSGTWVLEQKRSDAAAGTPGTLTITQSPQSFTVARQVDGQLDETVYELRTATPIEANEVRGPAELGTTTELQATAQWENGYLETRRVLSISGKTVTQVERRTLNQTGREMTVETVLQVQHGYEVGQAQSGAKNVYIKQMR